MRKFIEWLRLRYDIPIGLSPKEVIVAVLRRKLGCNHPDKNIIDMGSYNLDDWRCSRCWTKL